MKKFFSLCVTVAVALFGLTCCGGGGDNNPDAMSVKDFAAGAKKFRLGYQLQLDIIPYGADGRDSRVTETRAAMIPGVMDAGKSTIPVSMTYWVDDAEEGNMAYLSFSVTDSAEDLTDKDLLAGLGFPVMATDNDSDTSIILPNTVTSISGIKAELQFDFNAGTMRCTGTYEGYTLNADGTQSSTTTTFYINNGVVPFIVSPR